MCLFPRCWRAEDEKQALLTFTSHISFPPFYFLLSFSFCAAFLPLPSHYVIFFPLFLFVCRFPLMLFPLSHPFSLFLSPFLSFTFTVNLSLHVSFTLPLTACQRRLLKHLPKSKWDSVLSSMSFVESKELLVGSVFEQTTSSVSYFFGVS